MDTNSQPTPSVTTTHVNHFTYVWNHHKVGVIVSFIIALVCFLLSFLTMQAETIITVFIVAFGLVIGFWYGKAVQELEQGLFRSYAALHGFSFVAKPKQFSLNLPIEKVGHSHRTTNLVTGAYTGVTQFLIFLHAFKTGSGRDERNHEYFIASLTLPESGPHFYLDRQPQSDIVVMTGHFITSTFQQAKQYSLEGDFDKAYHLFGEQNDEVNLLEIINPAVMETLIALQGYNIELNGNVLTFYRTGEPHTIDEIDALQSVGTTLLTAFVPIMKRMDQAVAIDATQQ